MAGNEESHEELLSQLELLKRKIERAARRDQRTGENIASRQSYPDQRSRERTDSSQSRRSQIKSPLRGAAAAMMEGRGAERQERPPKQHTSPLGRRPDFDTTAHTTGSPTGMYEYHLERAAKLSRRLNYRKPVLIKDRDYRAGATYFDQPIMRLHYPERKGIDVAGRDIGPVARLVHDVSAPTHPHLAKGRGRLKLMRPVRNPFLDMNKGPPRGRRFYNRDVRDPMLEGEIPNHRRSRKYVEPTRPNVEDREFRHKQSKRRIRGPDQHDRNPVMDFMRGPPPAIRNTRKRNERMEKKLARPKGLPMHIFG